MEDRWRVAASVTAVVLFLAGIVLWVTIALAAPLTLPGPLGGFADPTAWWPILWQAGLLIGAWVIARSWTSRSGGPTAVVGLAGVVAVLGVSSYWHCTQGQSALWTPIAWTLGLFVGNVEDRPFDGAGQCPDVLPLSLQAARLGALLVITVLAQRAFLVLFTDQVDRFRAGRARSIVVVAGADADALPLLRILRASLVAGQRMVLLGEQAGDLRAAARQLNCLHVVCNPEDIQAVGALVLRSHRCTLAGLYILGDDAAKSMRQVRAFLAAIRGAEPRSSEVPARLVVRLDDPWQAEDWRRDHLALDESRWLFDAISANDFAARAVVDLLLNKRVRTLVVAGLSPFTLALLAELTFRDREALASFNPRKDTLPVVYLAGTDASETLEQYDYQQQRYGNRGIAPRLFLRDDVPLDTAMLELLGDGRGTALILGSKDHSTGSAGADYLAARHAAWTIVAWDQSSTGLSATPILGGLYLVGPTLDPGSGHPIDLWERFGRVLHRRYLDEHCGGAPALGDSSKDNWEGNLSAFTKESNIRQIAHTLTFVTSLGKAWTAAQPTETFVSPEEAFGPDQLEQLAQRDHESWCRHHEQHGWRYGERREPDRRRHPSLRAWGDLSEQDRNKARSGVQSTLSVLGHLGYRLRETLETTARAPIPSADWAVFHRIGTVSATRLTESTEWSNEAGEVLYGASGDYLVTDGHAVRRTIAAAIFERTHTRLDDGNWARVGSVFARQASVAERVFTLEGEATANPGDWILIGQHGEQWPVPHEQFCRSYQGFSHSA